MHISCSSRTKARRIFFLHRFVVSQCAAPSPLTPPWPAGLPNVSYEDESRKIVATSLGSGACTFVPDITCSPGSGHHVLVICISRCDGQAFSIAQDSNNEERGHDCLNIFRGGGFVGFLGCDQVDVGERDRWKSSERSQIGLYGDVMDHTFHSGTNPVTMGFGYDGCDKNGRGRNYQSFSRVKSPSHSLRFDLFCGRSDTRVCDVAIDGCKS